MDDLMHQVVLPPDMPRKMRQLPRDEVGRPIPFFVEYVDGKPDFRVMNPRNFLSAIHANLCWVCGTALPRSPFPATFVAGPMCLINRTSAEPPGHFACGEWSAKACPFLSKPAKVRREGGLDELAEAPGIMLARNPGVTALIDAERWTHFREPNGYLFRFSFIKRVAWMTRGREATRGEVLDSIHSGLPILQEMAAEEGPSAEASLARMVADAMKWVPK